MRLETKAKAYNKALEDLKKKFPKLLEDKTPLPTTYTPGQSAAPTAQKGSSPRPPSANVSEKNKKAGR